jgi:hypothetical protein
MPPSCFTQEGQAPTVYQEPLSVLSRRAALCLARFQDLIVQGDPMKHSFISYNRADRTWAEWIAELWKVRRAGGLCPYRPGLSSKARNPP